MISGVSPNTKNAKKIVLMSIVLSIIGYSPTVKLFK